MNDCVYSPVKPNTLKMHNSIISIINPHELCIHQHYCIFNKNRTQLETNITQLQNKLHEFKNIKDAAINGEIIYHKELDGYYSIERTAYHGAGGNVHYKVDVKVKDNFIGAVNRKIENLEYDLKGLLNFKFDVLHGKKGGYGYGD